MGLIPEAHRMPLPSRERKGKALPGCAGYFPDFISCLAKVAAGMKCAEERACLPGPDGTG